MKYLPLFIFVVILSGLSFNSMSEDTPVELKILYSITESPQSVELPEYKTFSKTLRDSAFDPNSVLHEFLNFDEVSNVANSAYEFEMALKQKAFSIDKINDSERDFILEALSNLFFIYTHINYINPEVTSVQKGDSSLMGIISMDFLQEGSDVEALLSIKSKLDSPGLLDSGKDYFNYTLRFIKFSQMLRYATALPDDTPQELVKTYQESLVHILLGGQNNKTVCKDLCIEGMCERKELQTPTGVNNANEPDRVVLTFKGNIELPKGIYCLEKDTDILSYGNFTMGPFSLIKGSIETFKTIIRNKDQDEEVERKRVTNLHFLVYSIGDLNVDLSVPFGEVNKSNGKKGSDGKNRRTENYSCNCHEYCAHRIKFGFGSKCVDHDTRCDTCTRVLQNYTEGENGSGGEPGINGGNLKLSISHKFENTGKILFMSAGGNGTSGFCGGKGKGGRPDGVAGRGGKGGDGGDIILPLYLLNDISNFDKIITPLVPGGRAGKDGKEGRKSTLAPNKDGAAGEFINF